MLFSLKCSYPSACAINVLTASSLNFIFLTKVSITAIGFPVGSIGSECQQLPKSYWKAKPPPSGTASDTNLSCRRNAGAVEELWVSKDGRCVRDTAWKGWKLLPVTRNSLLCTGGVPQGLWTAPRGQGWAAIDHPTLKSRKTAWGHRDSD